MKRCNFIITVAIICALTLTSVTARAEKVIYDGMCSPNFSEYMGADEAAMVALAGMGKLTITDIGSSIYHIKVTTGKDPFISDLVQNAKVISGQRVTFDYKLSDGKIVTFTMTPEKLDMAGKVDFILIEKDKFALMVESLGGVPSTEPGRSDGNATGKSAGKPTGKGTASQSSGPKAKTYKKDLSLLKLLDGPLGYAPVDPSSAGLQEWRDVLKKSGKEFKEDLSTTAIWFMNFEPVTSVIGHPAQCTFRLNIRQFEYEYYIKDLNCTQAFKIFDDLVQTLRASGVDLKEYKPSDAFPRNMKGQWNDLKLRVCVYLSDNQKGEYWVELEATGDRKYERSDYEVILPANASPGANLFGVTGLHITAPMEDIGEQFKLTLSPGSIGKGSIQTTIGTGQRTLQIPLQGVEKSRGLLSCGFSVNDEKNYRIASVPMNIWFEEKNGKYYTSLKDQDKILNKLYETLISQLRADNKSLRKGSAKELEPYGYNIKAKSVWVIDYGNYRDYYVLKKDKVKIIIYIISVLDK